MSTVAGGIAGLRRGVWPRIAWAVGLALLVGCESARVERAGGAEPGDGIGATAATPRDAGDSTGAGDQSVAPGIPGERGPDAAEARELAVEVVDDAGLSVRLDRPANRIISLLPAATETLVAMGAENRLVARTTYDDAALSYLPSVGGGLTPSIETIVSLAPDLVIAWAESGTGGVRPQLESLGIPVFSLATVDTAGIFANIERLGRLTGLDARADSLASSMRSQLAAIHQSVAGSEPPSVLYMIGLDPPMVAGPHVFIGEVLELAGGRNVFADVTAPSPQVSMEEIVRRRPEVVLVPAAGETTMSIERLREAPGWRELAASGRTRFEALPPDILHRPGPSIVAAARDLRAAIHPELPPLR